MAYLLIMKQVKWIGASRFDTQGLSFMKLAFRAPISKLISIVLERSADLRLAVFPDRRDLENKCGKNGEPID